MGITTTADGRQWAGFDVYDLAAERGMGKTDKQIYDQLMAEGFNASFAPGDNKRIGPDAWATLQASINQPTQTPETPKEEPSLPRGEITADPKGQSLSWDYGNVNNKPQGQPYVPPEAAFACSNFAAPGSPEQMMNTFSQEYIADNSVYQALAPSIAPKPLPTKKSSEPSVFEKIMNGSTSVTASPQTFQQVIQNA